MTADRPCPRARLTRLTLPVATAFALILGGCTTVGPDFKRPEAPMSKNWIEAGNKKVKVEDTVDYSTWWTHFNDPVLDELVSAAYRQNLPLQISGVRIMQARAQLGIAIGSQYPQTQQVGGEFTRNKLSKNSPNFSPAADREFWNAEFGFDASWELDFWGRFRRGVESAEANLIASVASYDAALVSLVAEVARTYVLIRTTEERIKIARQNVAIQKRSLQIAQVRFDNGAVTELDVTQATSLLKDTEASIPQLEIDLRRAKNALAVLLGKPPGEIAALLKGPGVIPVAPAEVAVGIPAELLRRRPDVRAAELQAATQSALVGVAESDLYPRLAIFGSIGLNAADTGASDLSDFFKGESLAFTVGPSLTWPIFNYGRIKNNVRVQDARLQELLINYQNTVLSAAQEVEDGLVGFLNSQEQVKYLAASVKASERSVQLANIQYRDGAVDYQRVLDTQRALVGTQDTWTRARGDIALNLVATYKALGGGWEQRVGEDVVDEAYVRQMTERTDWGKLTPQKDSPKNLDPPPPASEQPLLRSPDW